MTRARLTKEHVRKMLACCALLPPPGDEVVKELALDWLALNEGRVPIAAEVPTRKEPAGAGEV